jgi:hypothetical protein
MRACNGADPSQYTLHPGGGNLTERSAEGFRRVVDLISIARAVERVISACTTLCVNYSHVESLRRGL